MGRFRLPEGKVGQGARPLGCRRRPSETGRPNRTGPGSPVLPPSPFRSRVGEQVKEKPVPVAFVGDCRLAHIGNERVPIENLVRWARSVPTPLWRAWREQEALERARRGGGCPGTGERGRAPSSTSILSPLSLCERERARWYSPKSKSCCATRWADSAGSRWPPWQRSWKRGIEAQPSRGSVGGENGKRRRAGRTREKIEGMEKEGQRCA